MTSDSTMTSCLEPRPRTLALLTRRTVLRRIVRPVYLFRFLCTVHPMLQTAAAWRTSWFVSLAAPILRWRILAKLAAGHVIICHEMWFSHTCLEEWLTWNVLNGPCRSLADVAKSRRLRQSPRNSLTSGSVYENAVVELESQAIAPLPPVLTGHARCSRLRREAARRNPPRDLCAPANDAPHRLSQQRSQRLMGDSLASHHTHQSGAKDLQVE